MGVRDLFFAIKARDETGAAFDRVKGNLRQVDGMAATVGDSFTRMGGGLMRFGAGATAATAGIFLAFRDSLSLFDIQERAQAKVSQAVRQTGVAAGFAAGELFRQASALQEVTRFGDEEILNGVTAQLLTFTNIAGKQFSQAQESALNLATVLDGDLQSAAIMLGKALNDPVKGLSAMSRAGITFSEDQAKVIKALAETGDMAAAQTLILEELERQYGGQARAAAEAGLGAMDQLSNSWGDLKETVGGVIAEILPPMVDFFQSLISGFQALPEPAQKTIVILGGVAAVAGPAALALGALSIAVGALSAPVLLVAAAFAGLTAVTVSLWPEIENLARSASAGFMEISASTAEGMESAINSVVGFGNAAANTFQGAFEGIKSIWGALPAVIGDLIYSSANVMIGGVESMLNAVTARINTFIEGINSALSLLPEWATGEGGLRIGTVGDVTLGRLDNNFEGAAAQATADAQAAFDAAFDTSPLTAPDLGLAGVAESARAMAAGLREIPPATAEVVDSTELLNSVIPETTGLLDGSGDGGGGGGVGGSGGGLAGAARGAGAAMRDLSEDVEETKGVFDGFGRETSNLLKDLFADGKVSFQDFGDFVLAWGDRFLDRVLSQVFDPLGDAFQTMFDNMGSGGGGGGGGLFGSLFSGIGNFFGGLFGGGGDAPAINMDTGGILGVSGRNGIDRNVARFGVSNDEQIHVVKRGQAGMAPQVNVTIVAQDLAAFKASKGQIARDLGRAVSYGQRFA